MRLTVFILLVLSVECFSQAYSEKIENCKEVFKNGFDPELFEKQFSQFRTCIIGSSFPSFNIKTIDNKSISLHELEGKVVLINTWFIGCPPCEKEIPLFNELQKEFEKDFIIISFGRDDQASIIDFAIRHKMNYPVVADAEDLIVDRFKLTLGYPANILLDKKGKLIDFKTGGAIDSVGLTKTKKEFQGLIKAAIARK